MNNVNSHKLGLVVGGMAAFMHLLWALMVLVGLAKPLMNWFMGLHFLTAPHSVNPFSFGKALMLVVMAGVVGYLFGFVFGSFWNLAHRDARPGQEIQK